MNPGVTHRRILAYLDARILGATDEEMAVDLGIPANSLRPRRQELVQMGRVKASENRRLTFTEHEAIVWITCDEPPGSAPPQSRAKRVAGAIEPILVKAEDVVERFPELSDSAPMRLIIPLGALRALVKAAGEQHG